MFSTRLEKFLPFLFNFRLSSANISSLKESRICRLRKGEKAWFQLITLLSRLLTCPILNTDSIIIPLYFIAAFLTLSQTSPGFYMSAVPVFWKHCWKRRNCSWQAISHFPTVFSFHSENFLPFSSNLKLSSANSFSFEVSKIGCLGKD